MTKIGEWVSESPIPRWTKIEPNKLAKDYFLSALDNISAQNENIKSSYSYPIQKNITNAWNKIAGSEPARYFFIRILPGYDGMVAKRFWLKRDMGLK